MHWWNWRNWCKPPSGVWNGPFGVAMRLLTGSLNILEYRNHLQFWTYIKYVKKSHVSIIPVIHVYMRYVYSHSFLCDTYIITYFISLLATVLWFPSNIEKVSGRNTLNSDPNISLGKTAGWDYLGFMALNCDRCELLPVGPSSVCCVGLTVWHITGSRSHHPTTVPHLNNNRKKILFKKWIRPSET